MASREFVSTLGSGVLRSSVGKALVRLFDLFIFNHCIVLISTLLSDFGVNKCTVPMFFAPPCAFPPCLLRSLLCIMFYRAVFCWGSPVGCLLCSWPRTWASFVFGRGFASRRCFPLGCFFDLLFLLRLSSARPDLLYFNQVSRDPPVLFHPQTEHFPQVFPPLPFTACFIFLSAVPAKKLSGQINGEGAPPFPKLVWGPSHRSFIMLPCPCFCCACLCYDAANPFLFSGWKFLLFRRRFPPLGGRVLNSRYPTRVPNMVGMISDPHPPNPQCIRHTPILAPP